MNKKQMTMRKQKLMTLILFLPFLLVRIIFKRQNNLDKRTET